MNDSYLPSNVWHYAVLCATWMLIIQVRDTLGWKSWIIQICCIIYMWHDCMSVCMCFCPYVCLSVFLSSVSGAWCVRAPCVRVYSSLRVWLRACSYVCVRVYIRACVYIHIYTCPVTSCSEMKRMQKKTLSLLSCGVMHTFTHTRISFARILTRSLSLFISLVFSF